MRKEIIFLLYASHDGHTAHIIRYLASLLMYKEKLVSVYNLEDRSPPDFMLEEAASIIIISPVRYGRHLKSVDNFIKQHKHLLNQKILGMISINLTARKKDKNKPHTNPYYNKWLKHHKIIPKIQAVIAGKLEYRIYNWWEKQIIRFIMKITGGPTDFHTVIDYTNWNEIKELSDEITSLSFEKKEAA